MNIEDQINQYLLAKLKELKQRSGERVNTVSVQADDFDPSGLRVKYGAYTPGIVIDGKETAQAAIDELISRMEPAALENQASSLRAAAEDLIKQAEELERRAA